MSRRNDRPNLTVNQERRLAWRCARGDRAARELLIESLRPLARTIARSYARDADHRAELEQVGAVGLIHAVDRFDPSRGARLSTFAFPTVAGEIRRHLRDTSWSVHVPRELRDLAWRLPAVERTLVATLRRTPTDREIAVVLGCGEARVPDVRLALGGYRAVSIDVDQGSDGDGPQLGCEDRGFQRTEERATLDSALRVLPPGERQMIALRFDEDLTQRQIGDRVGCSQMQVSRTLASAFVRLREELEPSGGSEDRGVDTEPAKAA